jgi:Xaa-Pro aminopeptidase
MDFLVVRVTLGTCRRSVGDHGIASTSGIAGSLSFCVLYREARRERTKEAIMNAVINGMTVGLDVDAIQSALEDAGLDGWLFSDFRGSDAIADKVLGLVGHGAGTRRWHYFVPASGEPRALVHRIESSILDGLPGDRTIYLSWSSHDSGLEALLGDARRVAMQYSPRCQIPTISRVDAGTVELIRSFGVEVVSSADLVQRFEARLSDAQVESHRRAAAALREIVECAFRLVSDEVQRGVTIDERFVQCKCLEWLDERGLFTDHGPILAVNEHAADPHFEVPETSSSVIREGDLLLLDIWAKEKTAGSVFADITWCAFVGSTPPEKMTRVFDVVRSGRDAAIALCQESFRKGAALCGYEADRAARDALTGAGFGEFFVHRTGHSIHEETHGNGANLDDLETHDTRQLLPLTVFSIEPGVYLTGEFGIRSEVNVLHTGTDGEVTGGGAQKELFGLFGEWSVDRDAKNHTQA